MPSTTGSKWFSFQACMTLVALHIFAVFFGVLQVLFDLVNFR
jgi:hypothetical protein